MGEQIGKSPEEVRVSEGYRHAFLNVMASRGLTKDSITAIETANCVPVLEAECDDTDGSLPDLAASFFAPYEGVLAPERETRPLSVVSVSLGLSVGMIEIEPRLVQYTSGPKIEGYVTTTTADAVSRAVSSEIALDFDEGAYSVEVVRIDDQGRIIGESDEEHHKLTPDMMASLGALLPKLDARQNSQVSIVKRNPADSTQYRVSVDQTSTDDLEPSQVVPGEAEASEGRQVLPPDWRKRFPLPESLSSDEFKRWGQSLVLPLRK